MKRKGGGLVKEASKGNKSQRLLVGILRLKLISGVLRVEDWEGPLRILHLNPFEKKKILDNSVGFCIRLI